MKKEYEIMKYNLVISTNFFGKDEEYYQLKVENEDRLKDLLPEFKGFDINNISQILCYAPNGKEKSGVIYQASNIDRVGADIRITLNKIEELEISSEDIRKGVYRIQCNKGWKNEKLYIMIVDDIEFNDICYPEERNIKFENIINQLNVLKSNSRWLEMLNKFGDVKELPQKHPDFWNNYNLLDEYLVYPLSHLVTTGDKYKLRDQLLESFKFCVERVLELQPRKINTLAVYAYFYYCNYMDYKRGYQQEDYDKALDLYNKILSIKPDHKQSLYRLAKLNLIFLEQAKFTKDFDKKQYYEAIRNNFSEVIRLYELEEEKKNEYEYFSSLYNLIKFDQNIFLDYERAYFSKKVWGRDVSYMLTKEKANQLKSNHDMIEKLLNLLNIDINTSVDQMLKGTKKDQIDVFYRMAVAYQSMAFYCDLINQCDKKIKYYELSNNYIDIAFRIYNHRKKLNMRCKSITYLYKMRATNLYLLGEKDKAIQSLERGKSDSIYRAAELLYIDKEIDKAKKLLSNIDKNDKFNMYNKAERLLNRIGNE